MSSLPNNIVSQWNLTRTQQEVVLLLLKGLSNNAIACSLNRSVKTVEAHITTIFKKTASPNRIALMIKTLPLQASSNDSRGEPAAAPVMQAANG
ncbi:MAG: helix-turn-helix transcriptional regulator [Polyangiaceae bacterium]|nr:helix-turn-helix transcriptional regulator [Polyangiaceae bacterium]